MTDYVFLTSKTASGSAAVQALDTSDSVYVGADATLTSLGTPIVGVGDTDVTVDGVVHGATHGLYFTGAANRIYVNGSVSGFADGFYGTGDNNVIHVGSGGTMEGHYLGILLAGAGAEITNQGSIVGSDTGVDIVDGSSVIENSGSITGGIGIRLGGTAGEKNDIVNNGSIVGYQGPFKQAIVGGAADDTLTNTGRISGVIDLGAGDDIFDSRHGNFDTIFGDFGNDILMGNLAEDNTLNGGYGNDTMIGGSGDDTYVVQETGDRTLENAHGGTDTVIAYLDWTLGANIENLTLSENSGYFNATGNRLDNVIHGNIYNNVITGGGGGDRLIGGGGIDTFLFKKIGDIAGDVITDFAHAGDKIDLHAIDADSHTAGNQAFEWLGAGDFTHHAGELHRSVVGARTFISGDTDGNGVADFTLMLSGHHTLSGSNFIF